MALLCFVLFCGFLTLWQSVDSVIDSNSFCYDDYSCEIWDRPSSWPGTCQTGLRQSPIDLPLTSSHLETALKKQFLASHSYIALHKFTLKNTGHTVQLELASNEKSKLTLGGPLFNNNNYTFAHIDFHWRSFFDNDGSEHSLNGKRYDMEAHLVHYRSDFDNIQQALASKERHALTILASFFEISEDDNDNQAISNITRSLKEITDVGQSTGISYFSLMYVMYYQRNPVMMQYDGSLTTPDCNESVLWNVLGGVEPIHFYQLEEFWSVNDNSGEAFHSNNRPLQRANNRTIGYFRPVVEWVGDESHGRFPDPLSPSFLN